MSGDPFQPGHRAPSALRYRREGDGLNNLGDAASFGGYAAPAGRADSWSGSGTAATWDVPVGDTWNAPVDAWGAPEPDEWQQSPEYHWGAQPSEDAQWDPWGSDEPSAAEQADYDEPDEPFPPTALGARGLRGNADHRPARVPGAHRMPVPPAALKGRAAVVAVAAGAVVAAGQAGAQHLGGQHPATADAPTTGEIRQVAASAPTNGAASATQSPQLLDAAPVTDISQFQDVLHHGQQFAESLAAQAAAKLRPVFVKFASGTFTSGYGTRWGVLHPGVDIAGPIGTPIYAVMDGTVIDAGPASGFGMWVRVRHEDGTITVYGHVNTTTVSVGQHVMAGDQIATIGNRGFSTGPHCHFEVWLHGTDRIDPLPWLASRGISLGPEED
ncbi:M23 family metallopeptidase [Nocardia sp. CA2R105]|uniref:M23 family metallopeptidase n=1 Tax=Nocardia coffeae TaxID=2873381 RepID=UPI001CA73A51|nr:M23 family metallopeptidase [Nocardia coffeae]MBY8857865.1 M23 family metallopeptidase [Nocardia coffeae]